MRKIQQQLIDAIKAGREFKKDNTRVEIRERSDGQLITSVYLHDNLIAQNGAAGWGFKLCGWDTPTTRSRLNAIMPMLYAGNPGVHRVRGVLTFTHYGIAKEINSTDWFWPALGEEGANAKASPTVPQYSREF